MKSALALSFLSIFLFSCASSGGSTGYPFCDEALKSQKSLLSMYQAYQSDPTFKTEFEMERKRYDNQVAECKAESGEDKLVSTTAELLCGNDSNCKERYK